MITKLIKIGNEYALEIDDALLQKLNIEHDVPMEITVVGETIVIKPVRGERQEKALQDPKGHMAKTANPPRKPTE